MINSDCITASPEQDANQANTNGVFLLIDTAQYPGIWRILQYRFRRLPWVSLSKNANSAEPGPVLVQVTSNQTRTLAWFLEHTQGMHCMSWIVSSVGLMDLREHLRSLTRVETEEGLKYVMRYYDTRILPIWYQMLDHLQEEHALGPITSWAYMDRDGMPCTLFGHAQTAIPPVQTLKLTATQGTSLLDAALPDMVMKQLEQNGNADLAAMPQAQRYDFIADQVYKATKQYGIRSTQEIVLFCSLALGIGRNFDKLLPVAKVLQKFASNNSIGNFGSLQSA